VRAAGGAVVLALLAMGAAALPGWAQEPPAPEQGAAARFEQESPRQTFARFLDAMNAFKREGDRAYLDEAAFLFDIPGDPVLRLEIGRKSARLLKNFLDRWELIDLEDLPVQVEGDRWVYLRHPEGVISVTRAADGRWLFSEETVDSLDALYELVREEEVVAGIEGGGGAPLTVADWIRLQLPASLRERTLLLENWQWLGLLLIALFGLIVERILTFFLGSWLRRTLERSQVPLGGKVVGRFERPLAVLAMAVVWALLLGVLDLPLVALRVLLVATRLVIGIAGVWAAYRLVDVAAAYLAVKASSTSSRMDDLLVPLFRRALKIVVVAFGVLFVAQNLDVNVTSLLAGLGIGGLALALAAKDTVENLFGSVTVLMDRPFQIGDWIQIGEIDGTVVDVGFRSTRVRTFYNSVITVPNSQLVHAAVDNYGAREFRRVKVTVSIQYDTPPERVEAFCEGIRELIRRHPYTRKDYYMVYLNDFSASSIDVLLYAFVRTPDWPTELRERHRLLLDVVRLAQRLDVRFAFPTRTLHVASMAAPAERPAAEARPEPPPPLDRDGAVRLGREEAEAVMRASWREGVQPCVDIGDPELMPPC
jgi:MscS family membrane protein